MLRKVDISGGRAVTREVGAPGAVAFVDVADLLIDDAYQRRIEVRGWKNVQRIAENFEWSKFSALMVSRRADGRFAIIDGQHRAHAAALLGLKQVPALIFELTPREEASAFSWINGSVTAMTPNQVFKAALAAFEPWAVQCDAAVARAGCRLMPYNASAANRRAGQVFCIGTVRKFVAAEQEAELCAVLAGVAASSVADDVRYYNSFGLLALVPAVVDCGVRAPEVVAGFLDQHDLDDTAARCRRLKEQPTYRAKSFSGLFADSVRVLLQHHVKVEGAAT
ncbi:MAG TPA: hypothetical protein ENK28_04905 [Aliiroseovarius sp.]|nr:hypothetical protein [Aliiroseovarius sp.]